MATEPTGGSGGSPRSGRPLSLDDKERLHSAVRDVEITNDPRQMQSVIQLLRDEVGEAFSPARFAATGVDSWSILNACVKLGTVREFCRALGLVGARTDAWRCLDELVDEIYPRSALTSAERIRVEGLLRPVARETVAQVLRHPALLDQLGFEADGITDGADALFRLEGPALSRPGADRPLVIFLELIAHETGGRSHLDLHEVIKAVAGRLGREAVAQEVCRAIFGGNPTEVSIVSQDVADPAETDEAAPTTILPTSGAVDVKTSAPPTMTPDPVVAPVPGLWGGVPPQNRNFTGRDDMLEHLRSTLQDHVRAAVLPHAPQGVGPRTLQGLGGVGKSQLAVEYAYRCQSDYDLVWWIPADDERSIRRSFVSLARKLGLPESEDQQFTIEGALEELRLGRLYPKWLLVYDNAPEPSELRPYLPSGSGHVLITSRSRSWESQSTIIEVDVFRPEESVGFLARRWADLTPDEALDLADRLGHLPLALEQAAAVHQQSGMQLPEYLRLFDESPVEMLDDNTPTEYPRSVAKTWRLAFEQLKAHSLAAAQLLELCALLSSHPISVPMLTRGRGATLQAPLDETLRNERLLRQAVRDIGRYALAQLDPRRGRDFFRIHMLVRAVLRDGLPHDELLATERSAHQLLALANPGSPDSNETWPQHAQVAPHVIPSGVILSDDPHVRQIVLDQVRYLYVIGDYAASRDLAQRAVENWNGGLGPNDEMTLLANFHRGNALRALGEYRQAREINKETLRKMADTLGGAHEHTIRLATSVGADLRLLGDFAQARVRDEENLPRHERVLGVDHPATLRVTNNLAVDCRLLGNFPEARKIDEDTVRRRVSVLSEDNPETLSSINSLVRDLYGLGEYEEALKEHVARLPKYEERLPLDHTSVLLARRNLAILHRKLGNHTEALKQAEANYEAFLRRFGDSHEHTLATMLTLINTLRVTGDVVRARQLGEEALTAYRRHLGARHPFTLACANNVAITYRALGRVDDATRLDEVTLATLVEALGEEHPYALCSAANLANDLAAAGSTSEARALSEETLERSRRVRVANHPYTLACAVNLALDLDATGAYAEATVLRNETLEGMRRRLGAEHPETANAERRRRTEADIEVPPM